MSNVGDGGPGGCDSSSLAQPAWPSDGDIMDFTYDLTTDLGLVRFLVADTDSTSPDFADDEVSVALAQEQNVPKLAAALLLEILASNRARLAVRVTRGSVSEDLTQVAANLRALAAQYRAEAEGDADTVLEAVVTPSYDRFSAWRNELLGRTDEVRR